MSLQRLNNTVLSGNITNHVHFNFVFTLFIVTRNYLKHSLKPGPGPLKKGPLIKEPLNKGLLGCLVAHNVGSHGST